MGIDVKVLFGHDLHPSGIKHFPSLLTPERFPLLHSLAWRHPLWQADTPAEAWRWDMPKGCSTFEEAWNFERDTSNPLVHYVQLKSGNVILTFEDRIADLYTPVRWNIFVGSPNIQQAYLGACREVAVALGGTKCMYLADARDDHEPGMTLDEFEASLGYPPEASLEALRGSGTACYFIERFGS